MPEGHTPLGAHCLGIFGMRYLGICHNESSRRGLGDSPTAGRVIALNTEESTSSPRAIICWGMEDNCGRFWFSECTDVCAPQMSCCEALAKGQLQALLPSALDAAPGVDSFKKGQCWEIWGSYCCGCPFPSLGRHPMGPIHPEHVSQAPFRWQTSRVRSRSQLAQAWLELKQWWMAKAELPRVGPTQYRSIYLSIQPVLPSKMTYLTYLKFLSFLYILCKTDCPHPTGGWQLQLFQELPSQGEATGEEEEAGDMMNIWGRRESGKRCKVCQLKGPVGCWEISRFRSRRRLPSYGPLWIQEK